MFLFRIHTVCTDRCPAFQALFHWHLADQGIQYVDIKPRTPQLNGKVERSHRTDQQECYTALTWPPSPPTASNQYSSTTPLGLCSETLNCSPHYLEVTSAALTLRRSATDANETRPRRHAALLHES